MTPIGDIARGVLLQSQTQSLRTLVQAKTDELATGRVNNLRESLNGQTGQLHALQSEQNLLQAYETNISEVQSLLGAQQRGLDEVRSNLANVVDTALSFQNEPGIQPPLQAVAQHAFDAVVSIYNSNIGGRSVFNRHTASLNSEDLLAQIDAAITAQPDQSASDTARSVILQTLDSENSAPQARIPVGPYQSVAAEDPSVLQQFSEILTSLAPIAQGRSNDTGTTQQDIAAGFIQFQDAVVSIQANIGQREERLDGIQARNASEHEALKILQNELTAADPYEAATQLQTATLRLETLLAATARASKLSLTNYL